MHAPRLISTSLALALVATATASCGRRDSVPAPDDGKLPRAQANAPGICSPDVGWFKTSLQLSKNDRGKMYQLRKGTEYVNCWWQWKPLPLRTYWEAWAGWDICNACDVDVTVEIGPLPTTPAGAVLPHCVPTADANNKIPVDVSAQTTRGVDCGISGPPPGAGEHEIYRYAVAARVKNTAGPLVEVDPELEIERRGAGAGLAAPAVARPDGPR